MCEDLFDYKDLCEKLAFKQIMIYWGIVFGVR